jgi:hypothetical protein
MDASAVIFPIHLPLIDSTYFHFEKGATVPVGRQVAAEERTFLLEEGGSNAPFLC